MAEFLWNDMDGVPPAGSAGLWARPGLPMHPFAAAELARRGFSAGATGGFRSRLLSARMIRQAELILCMEGSHRDGILASFPAALNRTFTVLKLAELATRFPGSSRADARRLRSLLVAGDVADPVNQPESEFIRTGDELAAVLPAIAGWAGVHG